jgi:hypothetical protein
MIGEPILVDEYGVLLRKADPEHHPKRPRKAPAPKGLRSHLKRGAAYSRA